MGRAQLQASARGRAQGVALGQRPDEGCAQGKALEQPLERGEAPEQVRDVAPRPCKAVAQELGRCESHAQGTAEARGMA